MPTIIILMPLALIIKFKYFYTIPGSLPLQTEIYMYVCIVSDTKTNATFYNKGSLNANV